MPLVKAYIKVEGVHQSDLQAVCAELVPAALHTPQGELTPGSIVFIPHRCDTLPTDVFLDIEGYFYRDREVILQTRTEKLKDALVEMYPHLTFSVWVKVVSAGWASDHADPKFDGDMTMDAALMRLRTKGIPRVA